MPPMINATHALFPEYLIINGSSVKIPAPTINPYPAENISKYDNVREYVYSLFKLGLRGLKGVFLVFILKLLKIIKFYKIINKFKK